MAGERDPDLLRMLTVQQPHAYALAVGLKPVENRTTRTRHRGPVGIHAGLLWSVRGHPDARLATLEHARAGGLTTLSRGSRPGPGWARGAVIAVAQITGCHLDVGCCRPWGEEGTWHWEVETPRLLSAPVPARGQLGLWQASKALRDAVSAA
jgi:hypothetical protein